MYYIQLSAEGLKVEINISPYFLFCAQEGFFKEIASTC